MGSKLNPMLQYVRMEEKTSQPPELKKQDELYQIEISSVIKVIVRICSFQSLWPFSLS